MMIQATVPTALGLFFTPWLLDHSLLAGGAVTALAVGTMFLVFRGGLITRMVLTSMAIFYLAFAGMLIAPELT